MAQSLVDPHQRVAARGLIPLFGARAASAARATFSEGGGTRPQELSTPLILRHLSRRDSRVRGHLPSSKPTRPLDNTRKQANNLSYPTSSSQIYQLSSFQILIVTIITEGTLLRFPETLPQNLPIETTWGSLPTPGCGGPRCSLAGRDEGVARRSVPSKPHRGRLGDASGHQQARLQLARSPELPPNDQGDSNTRCLRPDTPLARSAGHASIPRSISNSYSSHCIGGPGHSFGKLSAAESRGDSIELHLNTNEDHA